MELKHHVPTQEKPLPQLRRDLKIYKGPTEPDGSPTYNCLDPVTAQYFKISWAEMTILQHLRPKITLNQLLQELNQKTTLRVTAEELVEFFEEAARNNLLARARPSEEVEKEASRKKKHPIMWVLYHYLYIRIPLLNPDHFLEKTLPYVRPLVSRPALLLYCVLTIIGLVQLIGRFSEFLGTFPYFFNLRGVVIYALGITVVKVIHEFSHAYVAKYYRLHVPTMGVALIVLWPVLYTDVTDGWKLNKRSQRLAISFAGVAAEVVIAGLSTLGWVLSEPGLLQSVFFVIASVTWISTLLVNLNPAMRFDGYYLMCDLSGIDNLQPRAFAFTRWQLRKWLLGLNIPASEHPVGIRRIFMIGYSIYTWIYRLVLYTVIAVFVYYEFTKVLGIILFLVEIAFFLAPPFVSEARQLMKLSSYFNWNWRSILTTLVVSGLLFWFIVPLPHQEKFPALTIPAEDQIVYVPLDGKIDFIGFTLGDPVKPGQVLLKLSSSPLEISIQDREAEKEVIQSQMHVLSLKDDTKAFLPEKKAELAAVEFKLKALQQQKQQMIVKAAIEGTVYMWDDTLRVGGYVSKNQIIAKIAPLHSIEVACFVPEAYLQDLEEKGQVTFRLTNTHDEFSGKVTKISPVRVKELLYPPLASTNKGDLPVIDTAEGKTLMVESYYMVRIQLEQSAANLYLGERGKVIILGPWRSKFMDLLRYIQSIYWRESGL